MPTHPSSNTALVQSNAPIDLDILAKYTHANSIRSTEFNGNYLHLIECKEAKQYENFNEALIATEIHLKAKCFIPILDDAGSTDGKIILNPSFEEGVFHPTHFWPPAASDLLIPGLKRLSKQLQVDFAVNVHGTEGKRRREQTKTYYDDQKNQEFFSEKQGEKKKKSSNFTVKPQVELQVVKPQEEVVNQHKELQDIKQHKELSPQFADKALDAINKSHAEAMAAKDKTIEALTAALVTKDELVRAQAALIAALQH